ncbi:MAG: TetR/AcrR family transcriptional regulator C-terminal domain-containing protein [Cellulosilyticaceae bacterium]
MTSSTKTKYKFAEAIKELMATTPLDKITVKDIVEQCDMTRQTFYRHFRDKYDLVNWYFEKLVQQSFKQMGVSCTLKEGLIKKFNFIEQERVFIEQAFKSNDYNSLINYDYECIYSFYKEIITQKLHGTLAEDIDFLLRMYCRGSIAMTVEWVDDCGGLVPEEVAQLLVEALPHKLADLLSDIQ